MKAKFKFSRLLKFCWDILSKSLSGMNESMIGGILTFAAIPFAIMYIAIRVIPNAFQTHWKITTANKASRLVKFSKGRKEWCIEKLPKDDFVLVNYVWYEEDYIWFKKQSDALQCALTAVD